MTSFARRRIVLPLACLFFVALYLLLPYLPDNLHTWADPSGSPAARASSRRTQEIHGLLYFVVNKPDKILVPLADFDDESSIDPTRPIELRVYAEDGEQVDPIKSARDWVARADALDRETPLVIFSKTQCPYSRRAKELLDSYDLSPPPRIIEVDQRGDGELIKAILSRLTGRATFPNVVLKGTSIGGSDTLVDLHERGKLAPMLRRAGIQVRAHVPKKR